MIDKEIIKDNIQIIKTYHEQTKHHYYRYANALGYMDWDSQPDPFRRFIGADFISLPLQKEDNTPCYEDIFIPEKVKPHSLNQETVAKFLEYSLTISAWKQLGDVKWALRMNPSSGNLHPTEGYLILPEIEGINQLPGVYHYTPKEHGLEKRAEFPKELWSYLPEGIFLVGLTSIYWREAWKYGERAFRYCQHDCGHAYMALSVAARMLGWRIYLLPTIADERITQLLGLNRDGEFKKGEEERPELLAVVTLNPKNPQMIPDIHNDFIQGVASSTWYGEANQLSTDHHQWEIIDEAHQASIKPETKISTFIATPEFSYPTKYERGFSAYQVIKKRRSAVAMDGETSITKELFFQILLRVSSSFPEVPWSPRVHLCLFVHRVKEIPQGLYMLIREKNLLEVFKACTHQDFEWKKPATCPATLMLYCLREWDFIDISKSVSCTQDIAGDGAFSLGMIAQFDDSLNSHGAWFYKRLFWETGMVGQLLYLEAEAIGISATGIGCFFDDPVHEILGFRDTRFQSLYHFTIGGAVIDNRLTTLPAHEH
ncbi:MAG: SagB/ThcOx family dehydrogenase [Bacteroidota bacterium]